MKPPGILARLFGIAIIFQQFPAKHLFIYTSQKRTSQKRDRGRHTKSAEERGSCQFFRIFIDFNEKVSSREFAIYCAMFSAITV
jgi:hypothetical protein